MGLRKLASLMVALSVCLAGSVSLADYKGDINYTKLLNELGSSMPTGSDITVSQIERSSDSQTNDYLPDTTKAEFQGKTFIPQSGTGPASLHATVVGQYFYGSNNSVAGDIDTIYNWEINNWLQQSLRIGSPLAPATETTRVQNHSWIGSFGQSYQDKDIEALRCFDFQIDRDGFVAVVGLGNTGTTVPPLMAHAYNAIVVGRSDGNHSGGLTTFDQPGRIKPDIVAPLTQTSYSTPVVGASAAMLLETADRDDALINARHNPQVIKAILMAGADRDNIASWSRTQAQPLDTTYGAGELDIYNSYHILTAGEQEASDSQLVGLTGWDFGTAAQNETNRYFFEVPEDSISEFSVVSTWHRLMQMGSSKLPEMANLDLRLFGAEGFTANQTLLDASLSEVDNVEMLALKLTAGQYVLELSADGSSDYGLAWQNLLSPAPILLPGDANQDGAVDGIDLTTVQQYFGQVGLPGLLLGDANHDGAVDALDLISVQQYFGSVIQDDEIASSSYTTSFEGSFQQVPEPTTLGLMLTAGVSILLRRGRRTLNF